MDLSDYTLATLHQDGEFVHCIHPPSSSGCRGRSIRPLIAHALQASAGRVYGPSGAAARLGIARSTLESKIRGLGIEKSRFRSPRTKP